MFQDARQWHLRGTIGWLPKASLPGASKYHRPRVTSPFNQREVGAMRRKVKGRDGTVRDVSDGYVLRDGEAIVGELPFMDSSGRTMIHESATAEAVLETVHQMYRDDISTGWQSDRWQSPQPAKQQPPSKPPLTFDDDAEAACAAAHAQYRRDIEQRWRK
jgi:hypothetical protein